MCRRVMRGLATLLGSEFSAAIGLGNEFDKVVTEQLIWPPNPNGARTVW